MITQFLYFFCGCILKHPQCFVYIDVAELYVASITEFCVLIKALSLSVMFL